MSELIVAAVNNQIVLQQNLLASPSIADGEIPVALYTDQRSASQAYNRALSETTADTVIFAHQDVYLPRSFINRLRASIGEFNSTHQSPWAVLGVIGATSAGRRLGRAWSSGLNREVGMPFSGPVPVVSIDELLIVVRRSSGLTFDGGLPGFHLYGTDIVQSALVHGLGAYVIHAPVVHNSNPASLGIDYWCAYHHLASKWRKRLPIPTCIVPVRRSRWPELHYRAAQWWQSRFPADPRGGRQENPAAIADRLGF